MLRFVFIFIFLLILKKSAGNHFLGGTITWRPLNPSSTANPVAVVITQTYSWTYSLMRCTDPLILSSGPVPSYAGVSSEQLKCVSNCGAGSTGYSPIGVLPRCTDFSDPAEVTVGQRSDTVYLDDDVDFSGGYQDTAWRSLQTHSSADWSITSQINLRRRSDNGRFNTAPVATVMSPINIPFNQPTVIHVPVGDADGDTLRCRWARNSSVVNECGEVCPPSSLPTGTQIFPNCTIIITGRPLNAWYAVAMMVCLSSLNLFLWYSIQLSF